MALDDYQAMHFMPGQVVTAETSLSLPVSYSVPKISFINTIRSLAKVISKYEQAQKQLHLHIDQAGS